MSCFFFGCFVSTTLFARAGCGDQDLRLPVAGHRLEGASPGDFVDSVSGFFRGFVAFCFLWVGWVPLLCFSGVFPEVLGWEGGRFFLCYLLHLASFSLRCRVGQHGLPTRKPPGPSRSFPWCVCPDPSPAGSRRVDAPGLRAGG